MKKNRFSIFFNAFFILIAIIVIASTTHIMVSINSINELFHRNEEDRANNIAMSFRNQIDNKVQVLHKENYVHLNATHLKEHAIDAIYSKNKNIYKLKNRINSFFSNIDIDIYAIIDSKFDLVYAQDSLNLIDQISFKNIDNLNNVFINKRVVSLSYLANTWMILSIIPIKKGNQVIGASIAGHYLNNDFLDTLITTQDKNISLMIGNLNGVFAISKKLKYFTNYSDTKLNYSLENKKPIFELHEKSKHFAQYTYLEIGKKYLSFVIIVDIRQKLSIIKNTITNLLLTSSVLSFLFLILCLFFVNKFTSSLRSLERNVLKTAYEITPKNEIKELSNIRSKNEINSLVSHINFLIEKLISFKKTKEDNEEFLTRAEKNQREILNSIQAGIIIIDKKTHNVEYVNNKALDISLFDYEDIINKKCYNTFCPMSEGYCKCKEMSKSQDNIQCEIKLKNGKILSVLKNIIETTWQDKAVFIESFVDITAIKQLNQRLIETANKAQVATRIKDEFLANMSHEIRTPMNGILGMASVLTDSELSEENRQYVNVINKCSNELMIMIDDILDYSKIASDKFELINIPFNMAKILHDIFKSVQRQANVKKLNFSYKIHPDANSNYFGDPIRIKQIITNLSGNSLKFTHKGLISVDTKVKEISSSDINFQFTIKDTGIGMNEQYVKELYNSFSQEDSSITKKYRGTGLGLTITRSLIELMGGKIDLLTKEGEGTIFSFNIILKKHS